MHVEEAYHLFSNNFCLYQTQDLDKAEIYRIEFEDEGGETLVEIEDRDEFNLVNEKLDMVIEEENEGGY